jgi:uncharacterized membrane protein
VLSGALNDLGPWGIIALVVLLVFFGQLVPRWIHRERIRDKESIIEDKEKLILRLTEALDHRDEQFDTLIEQGQTTVRLLEDLKRASERTESRHPS